MCQNRHHGPGDNPHFHAPNSTKPIETAAGELAECPVMPGSLALKADAEAAGLVRDYQGTRYWLCCDDCAPLFDANRAKYAAS